MGDRLSILIVDEDQAQLDSARRLLGLRYDVYVARGAEQGLEKLALGPRYAVVLAARAMQGLDGMEFLRLAARKVKGCRRILLAGPDDLYEALDAVHEGIVDRFLQKPCPGWKLEQTIAQAAGAELVPASAPLGLRDAADWTRYGAAMAMA